MHIIYTTSAYESCILLEYLWYYDILGVVVVLNELVYMLLESSYAYAYTSSYLFIIINVLLE